MAWLRIPPGHLRFILIPVPINEDAVKMILCNVFKPSPAGYPLMLRESIWSSFVPEFVDQKMTICQSEDDYLSKEKNDLNL